MLIAADVVGFVVVVVAAAFTFSFALLEICNGNCQKDLKRHLQPKQVASSCRHATFYMEIENLFASCSMRSLEKEKDKEKEGEQQYAQWVQLEVFESSVWTST